MRDRTAALGQNFAFFLPIMMASFGIAFVIVWSWGARGAGYWSAAFFCVAGGFAIPAVARTLPMAGWSLIADLLFASGFLLFSQALLDRWRPGWLLPTRVAIWALSGALCGLALVAGALQLELAASDFACFLLIAIPLVAARPASRSWPDRLLFAAAMLVALDNLVRGATVPLTLSAGERFLASDYAFLMQAMACVFGLFLALAALAANVSDILARYRDEAHRDPLSALLNRRGFDERIDRLDRRPWSGSVILCDIDHFKAVNDGFGHAAGDRVIAALADILRALSPPDAVVARFGGEEFVIVLPDRDAARAAGIAEDVRRRFAADVAARMGMDRPLTASFGLSVRKADDASIHDAIARADSALYDAKTLGRNRVCVQRALTTTNKAARRA